MRIEFIGGPIDGESREFLDPLPEYRISRQKEVVPVTALAEPVSMYATFDYHSYRLERQVRRTVGEMGEAEFIKFVYQYQGVST